MDIKITALINTLNEEANIKRAISSISWVDEIIVCDMHSTDKTVEIAKKMGAKIVYHKRESFVEPARNFAISKTTGDWIFLLDADEELPHQLIQRLKGIALKEKEINFVEIPRKNIIFGKWMIHTGWWPDYQTRFFRKGKVTWRDKIHSVPRKDGLGLTLEAREEWAVVHHNYQSIGQFVDRMNRYTDIQAMELAKEGNSFKWQDLFQKPLEEFLSRFFALEGYKDGLHGLSLSILQGISFFILYLKLWEKEKFKQEEIGVSEVRQEIDKSAEDLKYWLRKSGNKNPLKKFFGRLNF